ncbi:MAG: helix-turn-helix domain-containing protein [Rhodospirillales bacterium]
MFLTYRYRLLPTKRQHAALADILEQQRLLYNAALQERIGAFRNAHASLTYQDQCRGLTECRRDIPEMAALLTSLQQWTLKRLAGC